MGKSKELFILERERLSNDESCDGNCLECIKTCPTRQQDIAEFINLMNEDVDYD